MPNQKLFKAATILLIIVLTVVILVYGKPFLVPLTIAALLSMLLIPLTKYLEKKRFNRVLAIILSILTLVGFFALVIFFISWQVTDLASDASKIEQQVNQKYSQVQQLVTEKLGIPKAQQDKMIEQQKESAPGKLSAVITGLISGAGNFLTNLLIVLVYIFLMLYFRGKLKKFILKLVPPARQSNASVVIDQSQQVAQKYLGGLALMIVGLWIMYGIGFTIVGVKNAIFFAILCGLFEIVPFIGNLVGTALTVTMALVQGGDINMVIGILVTYGSVQFIQTYILEPLVVGAEVNLNPMATIIGLIAGEMVWGIAGMVVAIPLMGIAKIIFDHIDGLKPYAYLLGEEKKKSSGGLTEKIKSLFGKK